jgi:hypothetical protein
LAVAWKARKLREIQANARIGSLREKRESEAAEMIDRINPLSNRSGKETS